MLPDLRISKLLEEESIDGADVGWTLCFIGESQQTKLAELVQEVKGGFSETGDGKRIVSGFSYWGIGPTISWAKTCSDPFYPVMTGSIRSFRSRWREVYKSNIAKKNFHYVSLGVGTGEKDKSIIANLLVDNSEMIFFPVDMSSTMLRMAIQQTTQLEDLKGNQIFPIQLDFSDSKRIKDLRNLLDKLIPDSPILFSLLGNTLANFQYDEKLLRLISSLLREDDLLLVEVASTKRLDEKVAQEAAKEYANIESFRKFAASALLQNTNLHIDLNSILFKSLVEKDKAILIKIIYQNLTGKSIPVMLPDWSSMELIANDTIRLQLTRKYTQKGIENMINRNHLSIVDRKVNHFPGNSSVRSSANFGIDLLLVNKSDATDENASDSLVSSVWS